MTERIAAHFPVRTFVFLILAATGVQEALAQTSADASAPSATLEEVVVTATKRSEDIRSVPMSITAVSNDDLQEQHITNMDSLARSVPDLANANLSAAPGQSSYEIRGVSSPNVPGAVGQPTIGTYLDEVSVTALAGGGTGNAEIKFFDIDRVEVLRGPQGTLYGASSMGGTVRLISNQPNLNSFGGYGQTELSGTEHGGLNHTEQAVVNAPIVPGTLALRVGGQYMYSSGYIDTEDPNNLGRVTRKGANDDRTITFRSSLLYQENDLKVLPAVLLQRESYGGLPLYDPATPLEQPQWIAPIHAYDNIVIPSLTIDKGIWGGLTVTSVSSYFQRNLKTGVDETSQGEGPLTGFTLFYPTPLSSPTEMQQIAEELRVASPGIQQSGPHISYIAGAYLSKLHDVSSTYMAPQGNPSDYYDALNTSGNGYLVSQLQTYQGGNDLYSAYSSFAQQQSSVFGELNYSPITPLTATVGLRYLMAHQSSTQTTGGYEQYFSNNQGDVSFSNTTSSHQATPKVSLRYQIADDASIYATAANGFRLGGINTPVPLVSGCVASLNQIGLSASPLNYAPDKLWSYEIGTKAALFGNRVSVDTSAFYIDWSNVQQTITLPGTLADPCGYPFTTNAGKAVSKGIDLDMQFKLDRYLTARVGGNLTHAVITQPAPDTGTVDGTHLLGVPMYTFTVGLNYAAPLTAAMAGFASINSDWIGPSYGSLVDNNPSFNYARYSTLNFSAGVTFSSVQVSVFANNVLNDNKILELSATGNPLPDGSEFYEAATLRPRTIGVSAHVKF